MSAAILLAATEPRRAETIKLRIPSNEELELARSLMMWRQRLLARHGVAVYRDARARHQELQGFVWRGGAS